MPIIIEIFIVISGYLAVLASVGFLLGKGLGLFGAPVWSGALLIAIFLIVLLVRAWIEDDRQSKWAGRYEIEKALYAAKLAERESEFRDALAQYVIPGKALFMVPNIPWEEFESARKAVLGPRAPNEVCR